LPVAKSSAVVAARDKLQFKGHMPMAKENRPRVKKEARRGKRSRSAVMREIRHEHPTVQERKAITEGRRAYKRGDVVALGRAKRPVIESRPRVLAGETVVKGTRIPARLIADLVRQGVSRATIRSEYDLSREQIEAAILFDRVTPRRGRPPVPRVQVKTYLTERARRASIPEALRILKRAGAGKPPMKGDAVRRRGKRR
jgi:uncharacterized protein (DUF433 family)